MKKSLYLFLILSLTFVGCGNQTSSTNTAATPVVTTETKKQIVTSFYPLTFMTEQIVDKNAEVVNLAGASDIHEYEPSPQDMVKITTADLVIFQGAELETWTEDVIPTLTNQTLAVTHDLELTKAEKHEDHSDEEDYDEHNHGEFDPHTWLDPWLAQQMVDAILAAIINIDPAHQDLYTANAQTLKDRFADLDKTVDTQLSQCRGAEVIVSHDAYGYLARRYGFEMHAISGLSTQDEPSAKILAELKDEAEKGISHILVEENNVRRFADTLATETGLITLPINPLGKGPLDPSKDFFDIMEENLGSLTTALNCQS